MNSRQDGDKAVGHSSKIWQPSCRSHASIAYLLERRRAGYLPYGDLEDLLRLNYLNARELEEKGKVIVGRGIFMLFYSVASGDAPRKTYCKDLIEVARTEPPYRIFFVAGDSASFETFTAERIAPGGEADTKKNPT